VSDPTLGIDRLLRWQVAELGAEHIGRVMPCRTEYRRERRVISVVRRGRSLAQGFVHRVVSPWPRANVETRIENKLGCGAISIFNVQTLFSYSLVRCLLY
jgi:hypothetical protein